MLFLTLVLISSVDATMRGRNVQVGAEEVILWKDGDGRGE